MSEPSQDFQRPARLTRHFYLAIGWVCVGLGSLGIILPVLPTTPFLLVAVWAFSKASPELAERIRSHPRYGPYIIAWEKYGVIPMFAKVVAVMMMGGSYAWLYFATSAPVLVKASVAAILLAVAAYILTRPSHVKEQQQ